MPTSFENKICKKSGSLLVLGMKLYWRKQTLKNLLISILIIIYILKVYFHLWRYLVQKLLTESRCLASLRIVLDQLKFIVPIITTIPSYSFTDRNNMRLMALWNNDVLNKASQDLSFLKIKNCHCLLWNFSLEWVNFSIGQNLPLCWLICRILLLFHQIPEIWNWLPCYQ